MADEQQSQSNVEDQGLDIEESSEAPRKKGPLLSPLIIRILLIVALVLSIIFISIIVYIIFRGVEKAYGPQTRPDVWSEDDIRKPPTQHLEYMDISEPFRQRLLDGKMIQLKITLGYKAKDKALQQEISQIKPEIRDIIIKHLSRLNSSDFVDESGSSLEKLEEDFLKQINRILNSGKVERVLFQEYTLM
jgi:flagellar basal body-associated protein FliL